MGKNNTKKQTRESLVLNAKRSLCYGHDRDRFWKHREQMKLIKETNLRQRQQVQLDQDAHAHKLLLQNITSTDMDWEEQYWDLKSTYINHDWNPTRYMHSFPHTNPWWAQYTHDMEKACVDDKVPYLVTFTQQHENKWIDEYRHELSIRKMWEQRWISTNRIPEWNKFHGFGGEVVKMSEKRLIRLLCDMSHRLLNEERDDGFHYLKWNIRKFRKEDYEIHPLEHLKKEN